MSCGNKEAEVAPLNASRLVVSFLVTAKATLVALLSVYVDKKVTKIDLLAGEKLDIVVYNKDVTITKDNNLVIQTGK